MSKATPQATTSLPIPPGQKGFGALRPAEQGAFLAVITLLLLLLLPVALDASHLGRRSLRDAFDRPKSVQVGLKRVARFYDLWTWGTNSHLDHVRGGFGVAVGLLCLGGAYAGRCVHFEHERTGTMLRFGGAGRIRARVLLAPRTTKR